MCAMVCVCVHSALDVQREAGRSRCKERRGWKIDGVGGRNMRAGEGNWKKWVPVWEK